jgi:hypothetical protein
LYTKESWKLHSKVRYRASAQKLAAVLRSSQKHTHLYPTPLLGQI